MTMTHKEALAKAIEAFYTEVDNLDGSDMEAAIRAYIDARGLVMVPKKATSKMTRVAGDNLFAGMDRLLERAIAAAPDPFTEE